MAQVVAVAVFKARPNCNNDLVKLILETAKSSRQEVGVINYSVNVIDENLGKYFLIGIYQSNEAFQSHVESIHVKNFLKLVPDLVEEEVTYVASPFENNLDPKSGFEALTLKG
jgi:quinol monooxygenase YgiN